jgi:hypothetical protein
VKPSAAHRASSLGAEAPLTGRVIQVLGTAHRSDLPAVILIAADRTRSGRLSRPSLHVPPDEPDQVLRLERFREEHPDVIIATGEFGTWQARIPQPVGETVTTRYTLRDLLDRLD